MAFFIKAYRRSSKKFYIQAASRPVGRIVSDVVEAKDKKEARKLFLEKHGASKQHPLNIMQVNERK